MFEPTIVGFLYKRIHSYSRSDLFSWDHIFFFQDFEKRFWKLYVYVVASTMAQRYNFAHILAWGSAHIVYMYENYGNLNRN